MSRPEQESAGQAVGEQRSRMSTRVLSLDLWCRCSARKIEEAPKPHFGKLSKTHGGRDWLLVLLRDQGLNYSLPDAALKFCFPQRAEWWRKSWLQSSLVGGSRDWTSPCFWVLHLGGLHPLQGEFLKSNKDSRVASSPPKSDLRAQSHRGIGQDSSRTFYFQKKKKVTYWITGIVNLTVLRSVSCWNWEQRY